VTADGASIVRTIPTAEPPAFEMHTDCASTLYVAEPIPLFDGGGTYEQIDLAALTAAPFPLGDGSGEAGGFVMTGPSAGWFIEHTEFGPSPSSHLGRFPDPGGVWNSFAEAHIDQVAFDAATDQVFFPDACTTGCSPAGSTGGVQMFDATTGLHLDNELAVQVGFPPYRVVVAR
jgi:hypothetical protein